VTTATTPYVAMEACEVAPGDVIAYPAYVRERGRKPWTPGAAQRPKRDLLKVTRIENGYIYGERVHPEDWEVGVEFAVYPVQIGDNGVLVVERG